MNMTSKTNNFPWKELFTSDKTIIMTSKTNNSPRKVLSDVISFNCNVEMQVGEWRDGRRLIGKERNSAKDEDGDRQRVTGDGRRVTGDRH